MIKNKKLRGFSMFQFLMVRLKVFKLFLYKNLWIVSIPYGAIKRYDYSKLLLTIYLFQFLMVRLKAQIHNYKDGILCVSIPYGAIKRVSV